VDRDGDGREILRNPLEEAKALSMGYFQTQASISLTPWRLAIHVETLAALGQVEAANLEQAKHKLEPTPSTIAAT
jgi:hypothetical protein